MGAGRSQCSVSWWCAQGQCPMQHSTTSICRSQCAGTDPQQIHWHGFRTKCSETGFDAITKQQRTELAVICYIRFSSLAACVQNRAMCSWNFNRKLQPLIWMDPSCLDSKQLGSQFETEVLTSWCHSCLCCRSCEIIFCFSFWFSLVTGLLNTEKLS